MGWVANQRHPCVWTSHWDVYFLSDTMEWTSQSVFQEFENLIPTLTTLLSTYKPLHLHKAFSPNFFRECRSALCFVPQAGVLQRSAFILTFCTICKTPGAAKLSQITIFTANTNLFRAAYILGPTPSERGFLRNNNKMIIWWFTENVNLFLAAHIGPIPSEKGIFAPQQQDLSCCSLQTLTYSWQHI